MSYAVVIIGALLAPSSSPADAEILREAEEAFQAGARAAGTPEELPSFRRSAEGYETLRRRGHGSVALYRNEGNAYLLADDLPQAILAYRRGLGVAPGDRDLQDRLSYARGLVQYPEPGTFARPPVERWPAALPRPSLGVLLALTTLGYVAGCVLLMRWYLVRRSGPTFGCVVLLLALVPAAAVGYEVREQHAEDARPLVVIATDTVFLRQGNGLSYPRRSDQPLNRGVEVRLLFERNGWLQVELSSGAIGWVPGDSALVARD